MNQPRIIFEWHQETDANDFTNKFYGKWFATDSCYFLNRRFVSLHQSDMKSYAI